MQIGSDFVQYLYNLAKNNNYSWIEIRIYLDIHKIFRDFILSKLLILNDKIKIIKKIAFFLIKGVAKYVKIGILLIEV